MQHFICQLRGDAPPSSSRAPSTTTTPTSSPLTSLFFPSFFPLFFLPHTLQLSHRSLLPNLNSLPHTSNSLCLPLYPLFISEKASAISWHDTVCHQHCLPSAFDRGISTPLLCSPSFSLFSPSFISAPHPPSSRKLSFVAHCLVGI